MSETLLKPKSPSQLQLNEALHGQTFDAYKEVDFNELHFKIVGTIAKDAEHDLSNKYQPEQLAAVRYIMTQGIEAASNAFRPFSGKDALPVYIRSTKKLTDTPEFKEAAEVFAKFPPASAEYQAAEAKFQTFMAQYRPEQDAPTAKPSLSPEYYAAYQQTGPIGAKLLQELFNSAGLGEINATELVQKLSIKDLAMYSLDKVKDSLGSEASAELAQDIRTMSADDFKHALDTVVPVEQRYDFDFQVLGSVNYDTSHTLSADEKKAVDLMFVFMNALWKVQQIHRSVHETYLTAAQLDESDPSRQKHADDRISENRLEYQTYTNFLADSILRHIDQSPLHGFVYAAYGVQKDLLIYLQNKALLNASPTDDGMIDSRRGIRTFPHQS